jgi:ribosomal protein S18 acetylase RimI-like enzyme
VEQFPIPNHWDKVMWTIRRATFDDIDVLTDLRQRVLAEIGYASDNVPDAVRSYLEKALPSGDFVAFVAECDDQIIATSGVLIFQKPPHALNLSGKEGFVLNMFTLPEWRRRGIATALMERTLAFVREKGATCIRLHTSEDGLGIYSTLGFRRGNSEMVLYLNE